MCVSAHCMQGWTALYLAINVKSDAAIITKLLEHGANPDIVDKLKVRYHITSSLTHHHQLDPIQTYAYTYTYTQVHMHIRVPTYAYPDIYTHTKVHVHVHMPACAVPYRAYRSGLW